VSFISRIFISLLLLSLSTIVLAQTVNIVSPGTDTVSSPVRVVAEFSPTAPITSVTVSVDGAALRQQEALTPLDIDLPMSAGNHLLTVNAVQSDGVQLSASRSVNVSSSVAATTQAPASTTLASTSTTSGGTSSSIRVSSSGNYSWVADIEEKSGWYTYPDQGNPVCSSKPTLTSTPSLDGASGKFYLGPTGQYNNCLWPIKLGSSTTASHFKLETYYRLSDPSVAQGVEFSSNKHVGTKWYKFSVQCSYNKGVFSVWDTAGGKWSATNISCKRPSLNSWDHLIVQTEINNGKAVFLSLSLNGVQYPINKSFYPVTKASSDSFGVHFQMDGNIKGNAYYAWVDNFKFTVW
jgi:hypothetical protein